MNETSEHYVLNLVKEDFYPSSKIRFNKRLTIYLSYSYIPMLPFQNLDTLTSFGAR